MSMKRLLLLTLALLPFSAHADTLEDALNAAYRNNPSLEDARLGVRFAREDRIQARGAYLPSLGVTGSYGVQEVETERPGPLGPIVTNTDLEPRTTSVQLSQDLFTGGRRIGQSRLANAGLEGAQQTLRGAEQDVLLAAVGAYLSVQRDEEILRLRTEHVDALTTQLNGARRRLDVGEVSRTDVAQAQTRLAAARAALARAEADLAASRARYVAVIGHAPEDLQPATPPRTPDSLEGAVRLAETTHPDILQARAGVAAARARVTIERAALLPQVSIVGRYDQTEDSNFEDEQRDGGSAVAQFSVPLFEGGLAWSRTRQGRINVDRAEARVELARRTIRSEVVAAWSDYAASGDVLSAVNEQVEAAELAVSGAERERGLGLRSTLDVLNAEEERREAEIALVRARAEAVFAAYALLAATGGLSLENLNRLD